MPEITVRPDGPQGQPDNVTPCWACSGSGTTGSLDTDIFECTACDGTGLSAKHRAVAITEAVDGRRVEHADGSVVELISTPPTAEPERRTVSLEVLTDELRALAAREYTGASADLLANAKAAIVGRLNGRADAVTDVDTDWPYEGAASLSVLLHQAQGRAANAGADLLMPTPDVLAALDGRPDAQLLTAPVWVLAMDVTPGMLLTPESAAPPRLVTEMPKCTDPECVYGSCAVFVVAELPGELHQSGYARTRVRIPVAVTR
jgi:hypothetical protein